LREKFPVEGLWVVTLAKIHTSRRIFVAGLADSLPEKPRKRSGKRHKAELVDFPVLLN
jgi:hypothetical protein